MAENARSLDQMSGPAGNLKKLYNPSIFEAPHIQLSFDNEFFDLQAYRSACKVLFATTEMVVHVVHY